MEAIERLRNIDFKSSTPDDIRAIIKGIQLLLVEYDIPIGFYIHRTRKGGNFTKRSDMTYCPTEQCTSLQRASLIGQTMFYGVISDDQTQQENARAISACECSKLCREGIASIGRESFSLSHWEIIKTLHVASLITDITFPEVNDNKLLNSLRKDFELKYGNQNTAKEQKELAYFISYEFSKNVTDSNEYLISATIASEICMVYDGIVFPSVQLGGQAGLNIAIPPIISNKKLRFVRTLRQTLYKNGAKSIIRLERATEKDGRITKLGYPDYVIEEELGIKSLLELPIK